MKQPRNDGVDRRFGQELRRLRMKRGHSLGDLAEFVHYSKGHLSKIENGHASPTAPLARACDTALAAEGRLIALAATDTRPDSGVEAPPGAPWSLRLHPDGAATFEIGDTPGPAVTAVPPLAAFGTDLVPGLIALFDQARLLGRSASPSLVLPLVIGQTHVATAAARRGAAKYRSPLLHHAARTAEFAGWMAQEAGDNRGAGWWTEYAVELATAAGDSSMVSYSLVRKAVLSMYQADSSATIALTAQLIGNSTIQPRIRWLGALGAAQGHALGGDEGNAMRALERAADLWERAHRTDPEHHLGPATLDGRSLLIEAWCHYDLGNLEVAAQLFDEGMAGAAGQSDRDRARFGTRQALVHAALGDTARACALIEPLLDIIRAVDSVTIRTDLQEFHRTVRRSRDDPALHRIQAALADTLGKR
ncbi:helix-turn-helix domain-containing protein [Nocardia sp. NPDC050697]|uniref:helix-turn-helix domain-containing protein n=1 Tax=Nocardia sp. NPDC050697 TaxID=3155158 RepID=UPI0033FC9F00